MWAPPTYEPGFEPPERTPSIWTVWVGIVLVALLAVLVFGVFAGCSCVVTETETTCRS